jgi:hypothetical protein
LPDDPRDFLARNHEALPLELGAQPTVEIDALLL